MKNYAHHYPADNFWLLKWLIYLLVNQHLMVNQLTVFIPVFFILFILHSEQWPLMGEQLHFVPL